MKHSKQFIHGQKVGYYTSMAQMSKNFVLVARNVKDMKCFGTFIEYTDDEHKFCKILSDSGKIVVVDKRYVK